MLLAKQQLIGSGGIVLNDQIASREHAVISRAMDTGGAITPVSKNPPHSTFPCFVLLRD